MAKISAGILLYRWVNNVLEVFLVHPGGPFWAKKDQGSWSIPKGEIDAGEDMLVAAKREFEEETGFRIQGHFIELSPLKQPGGKIIYIWAVAGDIDSQSIRSNTFQMEWPPKSGKMLTFPEIDRAGWFALPQAAEKILARQKNFLEQLAGKIKD